MALVYVDGSVAYGERRAKDENILGVVTLEIFGLVLDPFKRELRPMRSLMKFLSC